jgi:hypothetical protein
VLVLHPRQSPCVAATSVKSCVEFRDVVVGDDEIVCTEFVVMLTCSKRINAFAATR